MRTPKTALTVAAAKDVKKLNSSAASVRGPVTTSQKPLKPSVADFRTRPASGMRTIRLRYVKVKPSANPKPGMALGRFNARPRAPAIGVDSVRRFRLIDLVEDGALIERLGLRLCPAGEWGGVGRHEIHIAEAREVFRISRFGIGRTIVVVGDDLLRFRRIEEVQIGLSRLPGGLGIHHFVNHCDWRFGL